MTLMLLKKRRRSLWTRFGSMKLVGKTGAYLLFFAVEEVSKTSENILLVIAFLIGNFLFC